VRLPFIQVADEAFEKARELADLLELAFTDVLGRLLLLWKATLTWAPDGSPVDGCVYGPSALRRVASAFLWKGDARVLADRLEEIGFGEHLPGGYRVRGVPARYGNALARQQHISRVRAEAGRAGNAKRWGHRKIANPSQTHRQKETEIETKGRVADAAAHGSRADASPAPGPVAAVLEKRGDPFSQNHHHPPAPLTKGQAFFFRTWDAERAALGMGEDRTPRTPALLRRLDAMLEYAEERDDEVGVLLERMVKDLFRDPGFNRKQLSAALKEQVWAPRLDNAIAAIRAEAEKQERTRKRQRL
jgi:hypothetical protein